MGAHRCDAAPLRRAAPATGDQVLTRTRSRAAAHVRCFAPLGNAEARWLVLGTMPGKASLAATEYYAHPRNAFWPIMEQLHGVPRAAPYATRVAALEKAGVAVWDVLSSCARESSLDSDIERDTAQPNEFGTFLRHHPGIRTICFNGTPARQLFDRLVLPGLAGPQQALMRLTLPSTSPANARMSFAQKLAAWSVMAPRHREAGTRA